MKKLIEKLRKDYIVITRKDSEGDTVVLLLSKATQGYLGSFRLSYGLVFCIDFANLTFNQARSLMELFDEVL